MFQAALGGAVLFNPERQADPLAVAAGLAVLLLPYSLIGPVRRRAAGPLGPPPGADRRQPAARGADRRRRRDRVRRGGRAAALPGRAGRGRGQPVRARRAVGRAAARRAAPAPRRGQRARRRRPAPGWPRWAGRPRSVLRALVRRRRRRLGAHHGRRGGRVGAGRGARRRASRPRLLGPGPVRRARPHAWSPSRAGSSTAPGPPRAPRPSRRRSSRWPRTGWRSASRPCSCCCCSGYAFTDSGVLRGRAGRGGGGRRAGRGRARRRRAAHPVAGAPAGPAADGPDRAARRRGRPSSRWPRCSRCPPCSAAAFLLGAAGQVVKLCADAARAERGRRRGAAAGCSRSTTSCSTSATCSRWRSRRCSAPPDGRRPVAARRGTAGSTCSACWPTTAAPPRPPGRHERSVGNDTCRVARHAPV